MEPELRRRRVWCRRNGLVFMKGKLSLFELMFTRFVNVLIIINIIMINHLLSCMCELICSHKHDSK